MTNSNKLQELVESVDLRFDEKFGAGHWPSGHEWSAISGFDEVLSFLHQVILETVAYGYENLLEQVEVVGKEKDNAYWERDQLVVVLSKLWEAHLARHPEEDKEWEDDW